MAKNNGNKQKTTEKKQEKEEKKDKTQVFVAKSVHSYSPFLGTIGFS